MAAITPQDGNVAFLAGNQCHTYWKCDTTSLGTNLGDDPSSNADNTLIVSGDISTQGGYPGFNGRRDDGTNGLIDTLLWTDVGFLVYLPSSVSSGTSYGLFHNGGGTHAQAGWLRRTSTGFEVTIHHNMSGTNGDNLPYEIPNADLDGWHCIGMQYGGYDGVWGDMALWVNGTAVASGTRTYQITYGSGNPDFGYANSDPPLSSQTISGYTLSGSYSKTAISGSGVLIANFAVDNGNRSNSSRGGNGNSWHTDYYNEHHVAASEDYDGTTSTSHASGITLAVARNHNSALAPEHVHGVSVSGVVFWTTSDYHDSFDGRTVSGSLGTSSDGSDWLED